jgi:hypothetical protein
VSKLLAGLGAKANDPAMPHLDLDANNTLVQNSLFDQSGPHADPDNPTISDFADTTVAYDASKAESESVYQAAQARSQPDQSLPKWTGLSDVAFYPADFTGRDGVRRSASIGKTTPYDSLTSFFGRDRANEQARNFIQRNGPSIENHPKHGIRLAVPHHDETTPNMHSRGGEEHFDRPIYISRHSGPAEDNGSIFPGHDISVWAKDDDGPGMIVHELAGHGVSDASPFVDGKAIGYRDVDDQDVWGQHLTSAPEEKFVELLAQAADEHGYDLDPTTGDTPFLGPRGATSVYENLARRYYTRPYEMRANGLVFKNRSLQRHGFSTLAEAGNEKAFLKKSLMDSDIAHPDDYGKRLPHPTFEPEEYNKLLLMQKSIYHSLDPDGKKKWLRMMLRFGMLGAPAAMAAGQGEDQ